MSSEQIDQSTYRKFGFTMAGAIAFLFGLLFPFIFDRSFPLWPWITAAVFVTWSLVLPRTLGIVYRPWMAFSEVVGYINSRIILGLVFFIMITPISLVLALTGKDPMKRKTDRENQASYWGDSLLYEKDDMEKIY